MGENVSCWFSMWNCVQSYMVTIGDTAKPGASTLVQSHAARAHCNARWASQLKRMWDAKLKHAPHTNNTMQFCAAARIRQVNGSLCIPRYVMSSCVGRRLSSLSDAKPPMTFFASPRGYHYWLRGGFSMTNGNWAVKMFNWIVSYPVNGVFGQLWIPWIDSRISNTYF